MNAARTPAIAQLHLLFQNTLPVYSRVSEILATRYMVEGCDFHEVVPAHAILPAELTVIDGQALLTRRPMLNGKWRRNGLLGTADIAQGLIELLRDGARKDDGALVMLSQSVLRASSNGLYFPLFRVSIDRLVDCDDNKKIQLLIKMRRRTQTLIARLEELSRDAALPVATTRGANVVVNLS